MIKSYPDSIVKQCEAIPDNEHSKIRVDEIRQFIYDWADKRKFSI